MADACLLDCLLASFDTLVLERCCSSLATEKYLLRGGGGFFSLMYLCGDLRGSPVYVFNCDTTGGILSTRMMLYACDLGDDGDYGFVVALQE